MKIRTDFVTNSSSSSFVAVNIHSPLLDAFLEENDLAKWFKSDAPLESADWEENEDWDEEEEGEDDESLDSWFNLALRMLAEEEQMVQKELQTSPTLSLLALMDVIGEPYWGSDEEQEKLNKLRAFLEKNHAVIDTEAEGSITVKEALGEDGFAYYQKLEVAARRGRLTQWPVAKGWSEEGYSAIQEYNSEHGPIFETIWDDTALQEAVEQDGVVTEFDVPAVADLPKQAVPKTMRLADIDLVNTEWIAGKLFVFTGLSEKDESVATEIVEANRGIVKDSVGLKTNYVVYNPHYDHETTKLKKAKELIEKGKPIQLLTAQMLCEKLAARQVGVAQSKAEQKPASLPATISECKRVFDCYETKDYLIIRNIKEPATEVVIPGSIEGLPVVIEQGAFVGNKKLERVVFSEGVVKIGEDSFRDCVKLKEVVFADSVKEIGSGVFAGTPWREGQGDYLIINETLVAYRGKGPEAVIPDGVKRINAYACASNWGLKSVVVPDSVIYIGEAAFSSSNLADIQLPNHKIEFGKNPFSGSAWSDAQAWIIVQGTLFGVSFTHRNALMNSDTVVIPNGVKVIGEDAFDSEFNDWSQIKALRLPEGLEVIGDRAFSAFRGIEAVELPSTVTCIGSEAFSKCSALRKVNFPEGLKSIGTQVFSDWEGSAPVEEVLLPDSVTKIGNSAFAGCEQLKRLRLPRHLERIPGAMVCNCIGLEQVEMPEKCRTIGKSAFEGCKSLEAISLPDDLESIELRAFHGCESLKALNLPDTLRELGWATFEKCNALTQMAICEGVKELPEALFSRCASLQMIRIPKSVKSINKSAFDQCPHVTIECFAGSSAEQFALKAGIPCILI